MPASTSQGETTWTHMDLGDLHGLLMEKKKKGRVVFIAFAAG